MEKKDSATASHDADDQGVIAWIEKEIGPVESIVRLARWRLSWQVDVRRSGELLPLFVRAQRGGVFHPPITLHQEAELHHIFERHGIPTPHVYGMVDRPVAMVMDRLPGQNNLWKAENDAQRESVLDQYLQALAKVHTIDIEEFRSIGLDIPIGSDAISRKHYAQCEAIYRSKKRKPCAFIEFVCQWLRRNVPADRNKANFVLGDPGQMMFEGDRLLGLIDLEAGHVGDPLADMAGIRLRTAHEWFGSFDQLLARYEVFSGNHIDPFVIQYHTVGWSICTPLLWWPQLIDPSPNDDFIAYTSWCVIVGRWAIEAIAAAAGIALPPISEPQKTSIAPCAAYQQLLSMLSSWPEGDTTDNYMREKTQVLGAYLARWNLYGEAVNTADIDAASALLGCRQSEYDATEAALEEFIAQSGPERDADLVRYFHATLTRQDFLLRDLGAASYLCGVKLPVVGVNC